MYNRVILIGRATRDPEMRYTPQGTAVTGFALAVDRPFKNAEGNREVDFVDCVAWRKLGEIVGNYVKKGRLLVVEGRLQVRSYDAKDGSKRKAFEVVCDSMRLLDRPKDQDGAPTEMTADEEIPLPDDLPF